MNCVTDWERVIFTLAITAVLAWWIAAPLAWLHTKWWKYWETKS